MIIENIMYFALGVFIASLVALIILPAVWKRAVRLTKRRIEAATPITMSEFRADKDQLRAEFALSTRRLEMTVDTLRNRLAEQLGDVNQQRTDLGVLKAEREQHVSVVRELETREAELRSRVPELERETTDLAQRLRMRERDLAARESELAALRDSMRGGLPESTALDSEAMTGDYAADMELLLGALAIERKRAAFQAEQAKSLIERLEQSDRRGLAANSAIAQMRDALVNDDAEKPEDADTLVDAEARIASAESRLNAILAETSQLVSKSNGNAAPLLADTLKRDAELESLRQKVQRVEADLIADWDTEAVDEAELRERLNDIATTVSQLVNGVEREPIVARSAEESLFARVQRFAADDAEPKAAPLIAAKVRRKRAGVSDRVAALKEIRSR